MFLVSDEGLSGWSVSSLITNLKRKHICKIYLICYQDGLREGPIDHGQIPNAADWLEFAGPIIEQRMAKYQAGEIHFNLMGIIQDKLAAYNKQLQHCLVSIFLNFM